MSQSTKIMPNMSLPTDLKSIKKLKKKTKTIHRNSRFKPAHRVIDVYGVHLGEIKTPKNDLMSRAERISKLAKVTSRLNDVHRIEN